MTTPTTVTFNPIINSGAYSGVGAFFLQKTTFQMDYNTQAGVYDVFTRLAANSYSNATGLAGLTSPETADAGKIATGFQDSNVYKFANVPCFTRNILFSGAAGVGTTYSSRVYFGIDTGLYIKSAAGIWFKSNDFGLTWTSSPNNDVALPAKRLS